MKKTVIIFAIALGFSITALNAKNNNLISVTSEVVVKNSISPFCMAVVKGDLDTVKKMIELGADVNAKSNGMTPAMYAAKFNRVEILKMLVAKGAKLKLKSAKGMTAEKYAKLSNATDILAYMKGLES